VWGRRGQKVKGRRKGFSSPPGKNRATQGEAPRQLSNDSISACGESFKARFAEKKIVYQRLRGEGERKIASAKQLLLRRKALRGRKEGGATCRTHEKVGAARLVVLSEQRRVIRPAEDDQDGAFPSREGLSCLTRRGEIRAIEGVWYEKRVIALGGLCLVCSIGRGLEVPPVKGRTFLILEEFFNPLFRSSW